MQHVVWPGHVSMHGGGKPSCFLAFVCLADPNQLLSQVRVLSGRHALSYFPPKPEWAYKHTDPKCVAGHAG